MSRIVLKKGLKMGHPSPGVVHFFVTDNFWYLLRQNLYIFFLNTEKHNFSSFSLHKLSLHEKFEGLKKHFLNHNFAIFVNDFHFHVISCGFQKHVQHRNFWCFEFKAI